MKAIYLLIALMQHCGFSEIILYSFDNIVLPSLKHKTDN